RLQRAEPVQLLARVRPCRSSPGRTPWPSPTARPRAPRRSSCSTCASPGRSPSPASSCRKRPAASCRCASCPPASAGSPRRSPRRAAGASALLVALAGLSLAPAPAAAQSLLELYEAAHSYDATYLSARALAESATFRVEQTRALNRPSIALSGNAGRTDVNPT